LAPPDPKAGGAQLAFGAGEAGAASPQEPDKLIDDPEPKPLLPKERPGAGAELRPSNEKLGAGGAPPEKNGLWGFDAGPTDAAGKKRFGGIDGGPTDAAEGAAPAKARGGAGEASGLASRGVAAGAGCCAGRGNGAGGAGTKGELAMAKLKGAEAATGAGTGGAAAAGKRGAGTG